MATKKYDSTEEVESKVEVVLCDRQQSVVSKNKGLSLALVHFGKCLMPGSDC